MVCIVMQPFVASTDDHDVDSPTLSRLQKTWAMGRDEDPNRLKEDLLHHIKDLNV